MKAIVAMISACKKLAGRAALLPVVGLPLPAVAAESATTLKPPVGAVEILSLGTSLVLVVGVILVVGWLYARAQGIRGANNDAISIVAAQSLGPKERILVVDIAGEQLVLGMTASQIQTLHILQGRIEKNASASAGATFADRFRDALRGISK